MNWVEIRYKSVEMSHHGHKRYELIFNLGYKLLSPLVQ